MDNLEYLTRIHAVLDGLLDTGQLPLPRELGELRESTRRRLVATRKKLARDAARVAELDQMDAHGEHPSGPIYFREDR